MGGMGGWRPGRRRVLLRLHVVGRSVSNLQSAPRRVGCRADIGMSSPPSKRISLLYPLWLAASAGNFRHYCGRAVFFDVRQLRRSAKAVWQTLRGGLPLLASPD